MIAADSSSLSALLQNKTGPDIDRLRDALTAGNLVLPPVVITEILSDPSAGDDLTHVFNEIGILEIKEGYWQRAGQNRRLIKSQGLKAKTADALIAQSCIDHNVALITRDTDFRHFAKHCGLKLA